MLTIAPPLAVNAVSSLAMQLNAPFRFTSITLRQSSGEQAAVIPGGPVMPALMEAGERRAAARDDGHLTGAVDVCQSDARRVVCSTHHSRESLHLVVPSVLRQFAAVHACSGLRQCAFARSVLAHDSDDGEGKVDPLTRPASQSTDLKILQALWPTRSVGPFLHYLAHLATNRHLHPRYCLNLHSPSMASVFVRCYRPRARCAAMGTDTEQYGWIATRRPEPGDRADGAGCAPVSAMPGRWCLRHATPR